jgi:hypothetical protein
MAQINIKFGGLKNEIDNGYKRIDKSPVLTH